MIPGGLDQCRMQEFSKKLKIFIALEENEALECDDFSCGLGLRMSFQKHSPKINTESF